MKKTHWSNVENIFFNQQEIKEQSTKIPYITIDNFPDLGLLVSLRFLEWVIENPEGVISLPTGKTPEYFIKWTQYILDYWDDDKVISIRSKYGLTSSQKPDLSKLYFIQIDEFYPLNPAQHNSFSNYVKKYYLKAFDIPEKNALMINANDIPLYENEHWQKLTN